MNNNHRKTNFYTQGQRWTVGVLLMVGLASGPERVLAIGPAKMAQCVAFGALGLFGSGRSLHIQNQVYPEGLQEGLGNNGRQLQEGGNTLEDHAKERSIAPYNAAPPQDPQPESRKNINIPTIAEKICEYIFAYKGKCPTVNLFDEQYDPSGKHHRDIYAAVEEQCLNRKKPNHSLTVTIDGRDMHHSKAFILAEEGDYSNLLGHAECSS